MTLALFLRRTYPDDRDERNREHFWTVFSESVYVGSIVYQAWQHSPVWHWTIQVHDPSPDFGKQGVAQTRDEAAAQFRSAWDEYREWLGDDRWLQWIKHMELVNARAGKGRY